MQLQLQTFASLVGTAAAAVQGAARRVIDLTAGSTLRALLEASASLALWLQWLIVQVLQTTRAGTAEGADLDSWMADFGVARLAPVAAVGDLAFARFSAAGAVTVPAGTLVRTADGALVFAVRADPSHPAWDGAGYAMPSGVAGLVGGLTNLWRLHTRDAHLAAALRGAALRLRPLDGFAGALGERELKTFIDRLLAAVPPGADDGGAAGGGGARCGRQARRARRARRPGGFQNKKDAAQAQASIARGYYMTRWWRAAAVLPASGRWPPRRRCRRSGRSGRPSACSSARCSPSAGCPAGW